MMTKQKLFMLLDIVENPEIETIYYQGPFYAAYSEYVIYLKGILLDDNVREAGRILGVTYKVQPPIELQVIRTSRKDYQEYLKLREQKYHDWVHEYLEAKNQN